MDVIVQEELRNALANEFSEVIRGIREETWDVFCEAAAQSKLDPYVALSRLLVGLIKEKLESPEPTKVPKSSKPKKVVKTAKPKKAVKAAKPKLALKSSKPQKAKK
ncbi:MAG: hypothetical protein IT428_18935 [Planctomycetaceae bacterium]|nr:hypothetical protein [Planctomycetaceae bacterium]